MKNGVLTQLRHGLGGWLTVRVFLSVAAVIGALALMLILLDAALDLPELARLAASWLVGICTLVVLADGWRYWRRLGDLQAARVFEKAEPALGNRLTNAVQLASRSGASAVEEFLRLETLELGRRTAANLKPWPVMGPAVKKAAVILSVVALGWLFLGLAGGDLLSSVLPRFLDPNGDHPPFSRLKIEVTPGHAEVLFGGQLDVKAKTSGRPVDKLWLVAESGTNMNRTIMFLAPDKSFFQTLANLREPAEYYVTDGKARSHKLPLTIRYTPQITLVEATTVFPEYTSKPPHTGKLSEEAQALPEGTVISYRVVSNRPLKTGTLDLTPVLGGKVIQVPLQPGEQTNIVTGKFTLAEPTLFTLSVSDVTGLNCSNPRKGRFNILPDERPRITVLEPGRDAVATPSIRIPMRVQATDDYGVTRVVWLRGHNRSIERPFNLKLELKGGPQSVEAAGAFELEKLGVRPGDLIEYYFEAADNYPKGPNVALSKIYKLEIISEEQFKEILRQNAARKALFEPYFELDGWLKRLAERARELKATAESGTEEQKKSLAADTQKLADDLVDYQKQLANLLGEPMMFDIEKSFRETLFAQHSSIGEVSADLKQLLASGQLGGAALGGISSRLNELSATEAQEIEQPARQIASVARLLARADEFVALAHTQATLAQMLRRFSDKEGGLSRTDQMEVQELAHQQRLVEDGLRNLLASMDESLAELPTDAKYDGLRESATKFVAAVAEAKIEDDLTNAAKFLGDMDAGSGYAAAEFAASKMDKLISKCSSLEPNAKQCLTFKPSVQKGMGNTLQQILSAMGSKSGNGDKGKSGYSLMNNDVGIYGPQAELAGKQSGGRGDTGKNSGRTTERMAGEPQDPALPTPKAAGRVRLQTDAKFPLRYRELVGDYFRAIADSENEEGTKK